MMKLKPQNTYRHLCNFAATATSRPILQAIHFMPEGHIEATNSHILLRLLNRIDSHVDPFPGLALHPKELKEFEGSYPDTSRLFPSDFNVSWFVTPDAARDMGKFLKTFEKNSLIKLTLLEKQIQITDSVSSSRFDLPDFVTGDCTGIIMHFNCTYLQHIMTFIADCSPCPVEFSVQSVLRPMVFKIDGLFEGLIAPVRTK